MLLHVSFACPFFGQVYSNPAFFQCVAVSTSDDATGSYNRYAFAFNNFPDYPKLGVWPDAYYISFNMFQGEFGEFIGGQVCAMDRKKMINGQPATIQCFGPFSTQSSFLPADLDGPSVPPAGSPNYFLNLGSNQLREWKFHTDFSNPANATFTGPFTVGVAAFTTACFSQCVQQPNTTTRLDALGDRLMFRNAYRFDGFGQPEKLVVNHSIAGVGGVAVRWYELRNPQSPTLFQQAQSCLIRTTAGWAASRWIAPATSLLATAFRALRYSLPYATRARTDRSTRHHAERGHNHQW